MTLSKSGVLGEPVRAPQTKSQQLGRGLDGLVGRATHKRVHQRESLARTITARS